MLAADKDRGRLLIDSVVGFVGRTPELVGAFEVNNFAVTAKHSGAVLEVLPADEASAWGLWPYTATVDEFAQWKSTPGPRRLWSAVFSSMPKLRGRLRVLTSSGDPAHWSHGVLEMAKGRRHEWRVSEVPGPCPWISAAALEAQCGLLTATGVRTAASESVGGPGGSADVPRLAAGVCGVG
jgi:hypothetical protein